MILQRERGVPVDIKPKQWKAAGIVEVCYTDSNGNDLPEKMTVKVLLKEDYKKQLPTFSNSPNSIYARLDANGRIDQVRVYKDYRPEIDFDRDKVPKKGIPQYHWHHYDHSQIPPEKIDLEIGRFGIHHEMEEAPPGFQHLIDMLGKKPSELTNFKRIQ